MANVARSEEDLMMARRWAGIAGLTVAIAAATVASARSGFDNQDPGRGPGGRRARNVIFFIGDGMGVSTITATRVFSVGVDGKLVVDQFPYTALSRTYAADSITP